MDNQDYFQEKYKTTDELLKRYFRLDAKVRAARAEAARKGQELPEPLPAAEERRRCKEDLKRACAALTLAADFAAAPQRCEEDVKNAMQQAIRRFFIQSSAQFAGRGTEGDIRRFLARFMEGGALSSRMVNHIVFNGNPAEGWLIAFLSGADARIGQTVRQLRRVREKTSLNTKTMLNEATADYRDGAERLALRASKAFREQDILDLLRENQRFRKGVDAYLRKEKTANKIRDGLLDAIPQSYPELFPLARSLDRHFILHIGPTNSGKSYEAVNALMKAQRGIYLAPLRLLAYEKFEELNLAGCPCSLKTGEEEISIPFSYLQSSTIEVLDFTQEYDVAVIDEAQMIADSQRGSAWTFALLGVRADTVHVCLAPEAEQVIKNVIEACGDSWEVARHERLVPLLFSDDIDEDFKKEARRGTAFIVFSRKDVHAVAGELQKSGVRCSVIYGALPYDVRRNEVKRYVSGETDVVVATDAIGMGLNLPIERVIFLVTDKFDGTQRRPLTPTEIKQIAGRAGRYGQFDKGYVSSAEDRMEIRKAVYADIPQIREARIGFPYSLTGVEGSISQLMVKWCEIEPKPGFENADLSEEIALAEELERETKDKELVYRFVMIPFDQKNETLKDLWLTLFRDELAGRADRCMAYLPPAPHGESLELLETRFKVCDMLYHYMEGSEKDAENLRMVLMRKNEISAQIMEELSKQKLSMKKCRVCGRELPFYHRFGVCEKCFARERSGLSHRRPRRR